MDPMNTYTTKRTSELKAGDVVALHGMLIRLGEPFSFPAGAVAAQMTGNELGWHFPGTILNPDEVTDPFIRSQMFWGANGERTDVANWAVQGNDLATWAVKEGV
jgi:hypothetical protein